MLNGPNDSNDARDANASGTSRDDTSGVADIDGVGVSFDEPNATYDHGGGVVGDDSSTLPAKCVSC